MRFADPVFIVPSTEVHRDAIPHLKNGVWQFTFVASLRPKARDHWVPYRVNTLDVGRRILGIVDEVKHEPVESLNAAHQPVPADLLWARKAPDPGQVRRLEQAS